MSAAECHLKLLDRAFNSVKFLLPDLILNLIHRRRVGALTMLFKIYNNVKHPLYFKLPPRLAPVRETRNTLLLNDCALTPVRHRTEQYSRCFIPSLLKIWNRLPNVIMQSDNVQQFKTRVNTILLTNPDLFLS